MAPDSPEALSPGPNHRLPLLLLLIVAAGFIIVASLIRFSTTLTFSYD